MKLFGAKMKVPELAWKGLQWELGSFCFEPSASTQSKLRRMNPPTCPIGTAGLISGQTVGTK